MFEVCLTLEMFDLVEFEKRKHENYYYSDKNKAGNTFKF